MNTTQIRTTTMFLRGDMPSDGNEFLAQLAVTEKDEPETSVCQTCGRPTETYFCRHCFGRIPFCEIEKRIRAIQLLEGFAIESGTGVKV